MPCILLSGFEPFYTHSTNVTEDLVRHFHHKPFHSFTIQSIVLPVVQWRSISALKQAIEQYRPAAVVSLGQSQRAAVSLEESARNWDAFAIPDNAGQQPMAAPIEADGNDQYPSTLPLKQWFEALYSAHIPVEYSQSAGTFVCNHLFYGLQHALCQSSIASGFVHMPMRPEQLQKPHKASLDFELQLKAVDLMLKLLAETLETSPTGSRQTDSCG